MTIELHPGQTLEQLIDERIIQHLTEHLTEHLSLDISTDWCDPHSKKVTVYYKDTEVAWDYLYLPRN